MTTTTLDINRAARLQQETKKGDSHLARKVFIVVVGLLLFGSLEVFSASRYQAVQLTGNMYYFGLLHLSFVVFSIGMLYVLPKISTSTWKTLSWIGYLLIIGMLIAVYFFPSENGAHRWIPVAFGFTIQPSEFAKIATVLVGALLISRANWNSAKSVSHHLSQLFVVSLPMLCILALVLLQPDLGNALIIAVSFVAMYLLSENKFKTKAFFSIAVVGILFIAGAVLLEPYRFDRIVTHFNFLQTGVVEDEFGKGLQLRNILIGVGSGGLWGKGIGGSQLKHGYFVEVTAFTDSISAVILEELGFVLGAAFVGVYLYLFSLFVKIAEKQQTTYQRLLMWGIAIWFITQAVMHLGSNVAMIPVKGTTLPYISYGGSSLLALVFVTGIALRLARHPAETA
ncbi:MAG: FtsW/RodA/SpoVE family cell cycle protein [Candidatus Dojkabacteria bacterium]|nr:MAG: FtsW/RodA/SpoVE family cell cycle protein [Candidatus Dojkabacteria bacterium]